MSLQFNPVISDPELADLLSNLKKDIFLSMNCHAVALVQEVNLGTQTLTASVAYSKTFFVFDTPTGKYLPVQQSYPLLLDVPFVILGGGSSGITFPIAAGDTCLIFFNDRDIDNWFAGANSGPVNSNRLHSLSDGIALVGLKSKVQADADRAMISNGTAMVGINQSTGKLVATNGTSLNSVLSNLTSTLTALNTLLTSSFATGSFTAAAIAYAAGSAAIVADITAATTAINELLE